MTPILSTTLLRTQSDGRLTELAGGGSERAFETIVERYRRPLRRYCARFVGESRAEDAVQEVFVKAWTALRAGPAVSDLRPWLYRIAHNASLNALRKQGYDYVELQESIRSAHGEPEAEQERRAVVLSTLSGLAALPDAQREALLRTAVDGLSQDEVARELGLTEPAIRGLVYRAREALRAGATALTPPPVLSWLRGLGGSGGGGTPRIAELVAAGGGAAGAGVIVKAGALISAGVIATGAVTLKPLSPNRATPSAAADTPARIKTSNAPRAGSPASSLKDQSGEDRSGRRGGEDSGDDSRRGRGGDDRSGEDRSGSSGSGSGSGDRSGPEESETRHSGSSGGDDASSGSSGSGSSGSGSSGSGTSGSGTSGSGTSGSGSDSSGSGSDDAIVDVPSGSGDSSGSGSSGSGSDDSISPDE